MSSFCFTFGIFFVDFVVLLNALGTEEPKAYYNYLIGDYDFLGERLGDFVLFLSVGVFAIGSIWGSTAFY